MTTHSSLAQHILWTELKLLLIVALCSLPATAENNVSETFSRIHSEHQRVLDELNSANSEASPIELDDPRVPALLKHGWSRAADWASVYIDTHPNPSKYSLKRAFDGFAPEPQDENSQYSHYSFSGSVVRIGATVYVIHASYFWRSSTGTFMIVTRGDDGHFRCVWSIKDLAEKHYQQKDEIGRWVYLTQRAYYNGPLDVSRVIPIGPAANGNPRFAVDAYQSADGGTVLAQLSIWEWDGNEARPLLIKLYEYAADYGNLRFDGKTFRILTKEDGQLKSFFSCGMCPEPRGVWTIRITPDGVQDMGHRFREPEFQWADNLLTKVQNGVDASTLADHRVVEAIKVRMQQRQAELDADSTDSSEKTEFLWGMLDHLRVLRRGKVGAFELELDDVQFRFDYVKHRGKPYFTQVIIK